MTSGFARRKMSIFPLHLGERDGRVNVSDDREDGVSRVIEVAVKTQDLIARERTQARLAPNAPTSHAVSVVQQLVERLRGDSAGIVRFALRFLDNDFELARKLVGIDERSRIGVGLHV